METAKNFVGGSPGERRDRRPGSCDRGTPGKDSIFGDLHATGGDGVEFYTERKVVIERWQ